MQRQLYVLSKELVGGRRLIGILSDNDGKYQFEYKLGGRLPEWFLCIEEFPDVRKIYTDAEVEKFIYRFIPKEDDRYITKFLESANLTEYNVWEMLKVFGLRNCSRQDAYLFETLPEGAVIFEALGTV